MVGVILRENPGFQLAVTMLVLFGCFWLQQKHRPYMSTVERAQVIAEHKAKVSEGHPLHTKIAARVDRVVADKEQRSKRKRQQNVRKLDTKSLNDSNKKSKRQKLTEYFWDYNTVEAVLLACAILVCLAGVMFESDRFSAQCIDERKTIEEGCETVASRHAWQGSIITYATILLVIVGNITIDQRGT